MSTSSGQRYLSLGSRSRQNWSSVKVERGHHHRGKRRPTESWVGGLYVRCCEESTAGDSEGEEIRRHGENFHNGGDCVIIAYERKIFLYGWTKGKCEFGHESARDAFGSEDRRCGGGPLWPNVLSSTLAISPHDEAPTSYDAYRRLLDSLDDGSVLCAIYPCVAPPLPSFAIVNPRRGTTDTDKQGHPLGTSHILSQNTSLGLLPLSAA
ncbi:hypothetical protein DL93DRAFT_2102932 [Clavulina sp. PMI_390]|nr:hypothetical protein DL93DRAFT_2102932 [Clavulina sp. PMI_390]